MRVMVCDASDGGHYISSSRRAIKRIGRVGIDSAPEATQDPIGEDGYRRQVGRHCSGSGSPCVWQCPLHDLGDNVCGATIDTSGNGDIGPSGNNGCCSTRRSRRRRCDS